MASWLKRLFQSGGNTDEVGKHLAEQHIDFDSGISQRTGLDFNAAINAHMAWKKRLETLLANTEGRDVLDPLHVCRDDQCDLGKWIHGDAAHRHGASEEYNRLRKAHADFHQAAAKVIILAQAGKDTEAQEELHAGEFMRNSIRVKTELSRMYLDLGGE
ncbi:MAG: CZB domain-containing protein [Sulfuriferula sp.]|nr:CZB domain-containing protein [Sulfuriferula sp.]